MNRQKTDTARPSFCLCQRTLSHDFFAQFFNQTSKIQDRRFTNYETLIEGILGVLTACYVIRIHNPLLMRQNVSLLIIDHKLPHSVGTKDTFITRAQLGLPQL